MRFQFFNADPTFFFVLKPLSTWNCESHFPLCPIDFSKDFLFFREPKIDRWNSRVKWTFISRREVQKHSQGIQLISCMDYCHPWSKIKVSICFCELPFFFWKPWLGEWDGWGNGIYIYPFNFINIQVYNQPRYLF